MPRNSFRFSESSQATLTFPAEEDAAESQTKNPGCYLTCVTGFIAVLVAVALAVGVGLLVGLLHPAMSDGNPCPRDPSPTTPDPDWAWQQCVNMSWERGDCLPGLVCPSSTTPATMTSPTQHPQSTTAAPPVNVRLPATLAPTHYNVLLRPDIYGEDPGRFSFTGTVDIFFTCIQNTEEIIVHAKLLNITVVRVKDEVGKNVTVRDTERDLSREFFIVKTQSTLMEGSSYVVQFEFSGPIRADLVGLYYSSYKIGSETRYLMASQLQATDARKVFPCFDEPALKATFNTTIERRAPYSAMSNTVIYRTENTSDGWSRDYFSTTPPMSTYLLAFIVSDFDCVNSTTEDNKQVEICSRPDGIKQTQFALSVAGPLQDFFTEYHNISLPLSKIAHVAVPDFGAGAMENWGLVIYRETALLYDPMTSTAAARQRVAIVISHELAHMWFGDLVTPAWWDDLWLNEGFASYMEIKGAHNVLPDWGMINNAITSDVLPSMALDALTTSHPVYQPVENPAQISELFDTITYSKGASVIRMMEFFLGEDTFRLGLTNYLNDRKFDAAHHSDLFRFMTEQAVRDNKDINVTSVMNSWIMQTGFPVVTFDYDASSGKILLSQKRFLLMGADSADSTLWEIPISVVNDTEPAWENSTIEWLRESNGEITSGVGAGAKWIIGNVRFQCFYRVNYNSENWEALTLQLHSNHSKIDVANRVQIIDDSFNLGRAGETDQLLALNISTYMREERDYVPWVGMEQGLSYLSRMLDLTADYGYLRDYVQTLVADVYTELGWQDDVNQPHLERLLRSTVLQMACEYGHRDCMDTAHSNFITWKENATSIASGIQPLVYCQGVRMGMDDDWYYVFERYKMSKSGAERKTFLRALACTREHWMLQRYLTLAFEEVDIRRQDFELVLSEVSNNPLARQIAWNFFVTNWDAIFERFGSSSFSLGDMVEEITKTFSTQSQLDELTHFMDEHPDRGTASAAFQNAVESTKANIVWRNRNEKQIYDWLQSQLGK